MPIYETIGKRVLDIAISAIVLLLSLPLMIVVAVAVHIALGSPVLFAQERPGLAGRSFRLYKFRSMIDAAGPDGRQLPDEKRLTRVGRWLRQTSVDELPQLWNVLKGDMSLVGPRPLLTEYLSLYSPEQARRHDAKPGVTGLTQVMGRNALSWEEKFALDVWYVDHQTFAVDMKILALTVLRVLRPRGIAAPGSETMPKFTGSRKA